MESPNKQCPQCKILVPAKSKHCDCGYMFQGYEGKKGKEKKPAQDVIITDIAIPFSSMVLFMVTWAIAAIPAFLILVLLGFGLVSILGGLGALL